MRAERRGCSVDVVHVKARDASTLGESVTSPRRRSRASVALGCENTETDTSQKANPPMTAAFVGPPNGSHDKLCGRGPRAEAVAARRLPRPRPKRQTRFATAVTPSAWDAAAGSAGGPKRGRTSFIVKLGRRCGSTMLSTALPLLRDENLGYSKISFPTLHPDDEVILRIPS